MSRPNRPAESWRDDRRGASTPSVGSTISGTWSAAVRPRPGWSAYEAVAAGPRATPTPTWCCPASSLGGAARPGRPPSDRADLRALRATGLLDAIIADAAGRRSRRIDPPCPYALRLGVVPALYMRVPAHAAGSSKVDTLSRGRPARRPAFANASAARSHPSLDDWLGALSPTRETDPFGYLALTRNLHSG